jgi:NADH dehydrogenase
MANRCVTVFGGSGFLGSRIVRRLVDGGAVVRVAVRHPDRVARFDSAGTSGQIVPTYADVWDEISVAPAVKGADAVVNTVGHYVERGKSTFEAIHGQGAMHVARASASAGVRRLVHISGLGADLASGSPYVRARAKGEARRGNKGSVRSPHSRAGQTFGKPRRTIRPSPAHGG